MSNQRLINYLANHLDPINFISDYQNKTLPVTILFYKMCSSFPKEKLGGIKGAYKHIQSEKNKVFQQILTPEEFSQVLKQQNNFRPKVGQYLEFITLSILQTTINQPNLLNFSNIQQDISEGWDFKFNGKKFDVTTNQNKIPRPDVTLIKLNPAVLLDQDNLILPDAIKNIALTLEQNGINLAKDKLDYTETIVGKVRQKYIEISNHKVLIQPITTPILVEKSSDEIAIEVPLLNGESLPVAVKETKMGAVSQETLMLLADIEKLTPQQRSHLQAIVFSMINSKP